MDVKPRNLAATRAVRLGLGHIRDVSMIEGEVEVLEIDALPQQRVTGSPRTTASTRVRWPPEPLVPHVLPEAG
jgi:hypothetical protein